MINNFQRSGSNSNSEVGSKFEDMAREYFRKSNILHKDGVELQKPFHLHIGISRKKDDHKFDLGSKQPPVLVECKDRKWLASGDVPSGTTCAFTEAMYFFHLAPKGYRKILFARRDYNTKKKESLVGHYVKNRGHLIPDDVEVWEYDETKSRAVKVYPETLPDQSTPPASNPTVSDDRERSL